jgi:hypothetical protein
MSQDADGFKPKKRSSDDPFGISAIGTEDGEDLELAAEVQQTAKSFIAMLSRRHEKAKLKKRRDKDGDDARPESTVAAGDDKAAGSSENLLSDFWEQREVSQGVRRPNKAAQKAARDAEEEEGNSSDAEVVLPKAKRGTTKAKRDTTELVVEHFAKRDVVDGAKPERKKRRVTEEASAPKPVARRMSAAAVEAMPKTAAEPAAPLKKQARPGQGRTSRHASLQATATEKPNKKAGGLFASNDDMWNE